VAGFAKRTERDTRRAFQSRAAHGNLWTYTGRWQAGNGGKDSRQAFYISDRHDPDTGQSMRSDHSTTTLKSASTSLLVCLLMLSGIQLIAHLEAGGRSQFEQAGPLSAFRNCDVTYTTILAWLLGTGALVFVFKQAGKNPGSRDSAIIPYLIRRNALPVPSLRWWEAAAAIVPVLLIFPLVQIRFLAQDRCTFAPNLPSLITFFPMVWVVLVMLYLRIRSKTR
jgi:hypothetical protein